MKHLFYEDLCSITFLNIKVISQSSLRFTELNLPAAPRSIQKSENDCDVILCSKCNRT